MDAYAVQILQRHLAHWLSPEHLGFCLSSHAELFDLDLIALFENPPPPPEGFDG